MVKPERKTKLQRGMMKPKMFKNNPGFPSQDLIVQVVTFLRIHEFSHKKVAVYGRAKLLLPQAFWKTPRIHDLSIWAMPIQYGHANPPPKKNPTETNSKISPQQKALSTFPMFFVAESSIYEWTLVSNLFVKIDEGKFHKNFKSFVVSFSASALAFFAASKASASALRFVPWRFEKKFHEVGNKTELNLVEPLTDLKNQYVPPSFRLKTHIFIKTIMKISCGPPHTTTVTFLDLTWAANDLGNCKVWEVVHSNYLKLLPGFQNDQAWQLNLHHRAKQKHLLQELKP